MDPFQGVNRIPVSLHKYLYANADPVNFTDPSGNFSIGEALAIANTIGTLFSTVQTAINVFQITTGEKDFSARELGTTVLLGLLPAKYVKNLFSKFCSRKNSFAEGTLVNTSDGLTPIQDIRIGDLVLSYNEEAHVFENKEVIHLISGVSDSIILIEFSNGEIIQATGEHPFYVEGNWLEANKIKPGFKLFSSEREYIKVKAVRTIRSVRKVYNLTVLENHNYFVSEHNVLVHNTNKKMCNIFNSNGTINRFIAISSKKLQRKWKHAIDFGIPGNFNKANSKLYRKAIENHVKDSKTTPIAGKYRGVDVIHYLDSKTGVNVIKDLDGNFISGWKLGAAQLQNVLKHGGLN